MTDDDIRQTTVTFSCTPEQKEALQQAAASFGWTVTAYILRAVGLLEWPDGVPAPDGWPPIKEAA